MNAASREFDRMQQEYMDEVKADAVRIMKETLESPDRAMERAKERWDRAALEKYTERQKANDCELLAKAVEELPDCPVCGCRPVLTMDDASLVKCGRRKCMLANCKFRLDEWREQAEQPTHKMQCDVSVVNILEEWGMLNEKRCYAECHYYGGNKDMMLFAQRLAVDDDVFTGDKLRITVEKISE